MSLISSAALGEAESVSVSSSASRFVSTSRLPFSGAGRPGFARRLAAFGRHCLPYSIWVARVFLEL